jgi:hypothetical protein
MVGDNKVDSASKYGLPEYALAAPAATTTMQWKHNASTGFDSTLVTDIPNGSDYTLLFFDSLSRYQSYLVRDQWQQLSIARVITGFSMVIGAEQLMLTNTPIRSWFGRILAALTRHLQPSILSQPNSGYIMVPNCWTQFPGQPCDRVSYSIYAIGVLKIQRIENQKLSCTSMNKKHFVCCNWLST